MRQEIAAMSRIEKVIEDYFSELGIKPYKNILQFWSALDEEYGMTRARQLESAYIKLEEGDDRGFYSTIFEEYDVGIAFASLRINLYRQFMVWFDSFLSSSNSPATILDVGCGNGVLTCLIAKAFPDHKLIGFDISGEGINCANILKKKLNLENVEFVHADAEQLSSSIDEKVNVAISVATLDPDQENYDSNPKNMSFTDLLESKRDSVDGKEKAIKEICKLLVKEGIFISFDKVNKTSEQILRINSLQKNGLGLVSGGNNSTKSTWISYEDVESEKISLPVLVAKQGETNCSFEEITALLLGRHIDFSTLELTDKKDLEAELTFTYINPKTLIKGARADYRDGTGSVWHEVWKAGPILLILEHSNYGYRGLKMTTINDEAKVLDQHQAWLESSKSYADITEFTEPDVLFESH